MAGPLDKELKRLRALKGNAIDREVALKMLGVTTDRIFTLGKDANNSNIGTYSEGYIKTRKRKGKGSSSKVTLQFTQQMRNDFSVVQSGKNLGLGFKNSKNADKSRFVEDTYNKEIFGHTPQEIVILEKEYGKIIKRNFA